VANGHAGSPDHGLRSIRATAGPIGKLNTILGRAYARDTLPEVPADPWTDKEAIKLHAAWWEARIACQKEIDASIARAADVEYLHDRPTWAAAGSVSPDRSQCRVCRRTASSLRATTAWETRSPRLARHRGWGGHCTTG
jgi:hypothetical protein